MTQRNRWELFSSKINISAKMNPILFLFKRLSQTERNWEIGNRSLLTMKLVLEERNHCFTLYTNHKNLEYLNKKAKHLFSRFALDKKNCYDSLHYSFSSLCRTDNSSLPVSPQPILPPGFYLISLFSCFIQNSAETTTTDRSHDRQCSYLFL